MAPPAHADGGAGGASCCAFGGGAGGTGYDGNPGGSPVAAGGGGGGGAGGGNGGSSGGVSDGGAGGTAGSPNGQDGSAVGQGSGGGGGGYNGNGAAAALPANPFTLLGGNGGAGANFAGNGNGGGGGGAGGYGAVLTGTGPYFIGNTSTITGGNGGAGGTGDNVVLPGVGGGGGAGGVGVQFTQSGVTLTNAGTITGGNGGTGGAGGGGSGSAGPGGAGIIGSGLTISNSGSIIGGFANGGSGAQAFALIFTGGANSVGSTGTISGGINVQGGSFAPALSTSAIGTPLTFNGPITFASGTQYVVRVSPSSADNLTASGVATLTGATVNAQFAPGGYLSKTYTILTATGGLGGTTFASLTNTNLPAGVTDRLSYDSNDVFLDLTGSIGALLPGGLPTNQQNTANALNNFFNAGGALPPNFATIFGLTGSNLTTALTQIDGELATGAETSAFQLMTEFLNLMPFHNVPVSGTGPLSFAPDEAASLPPEIAQAYAAVLKAPPQNFDQRWSSWGTAFGGASNAQGDTAVGSNNINAATYGVAGGMDYRVSPSTIVGFSLGGGGTNWGLANALGTGRSEALLVGGYGITLWGPAYLSGALAFANNWFTTNRAALGDQLTASFSGQSYGARFEAGYRVPVWHTLGVTPYGALQAQDFSTPRYSETDETGGGLGLSYAAMNATDVRTELGARFDDPTLLYGKPLILFSRLAWAHDFVNNPLLSAAFESLPGSGFTVNGAPIPHDSALTTTGAQYFLASNWSLIGKFEGGFAAGYQTYGGTGSLRYTW
jgi:uncharacterized protein with beta-barrel porin domain